LKSTLLISALLMVFSSVGPLAADELDSALYRPDYLLTPGKLGSLPPFIDSEVGFREPAIQPTESRLRVNFADRTFSIKTSYLERKTIPDTLTAQERQSSVFSLFGNSDLAGEQLKSEGEFSFNTVGVKGEGVSGDTPKKLRLALKGAWHAYNYGLDLRSTDEGFLDLSGAQLNRGEGVSQIWGETSFGQLRVKTTLGQISDSLTESPEATRITRASSLSLDYRMAGWQTVLTSSYGLRNDRNDKGSSAEIFSHELRTSYQLSPELRLIPLLRFAEERDKSSGIRSEMPSTGWTITYSAWRNIVDIVGSTSVNWAQSSDRVTNSKDLNSTGKIVWKLNESSEMLKTFSYELSYMNHLDLIESCRSTSGFSTKIVLTVYRF
jgi:hypothetical protein